MTKTAQERADSKYVKKVAKKQVVINPDVDSELLAAIASDDMSFSERCKELLRAYYTIDL